VTLYPSVPGGDSGELIVAAQTVAVAHPSGYPLYVLLAKGFTELPFGSIAWRANTLSAVCDAGAAFLLALTAGELTLNPWAGAAAGGLFAFSPTVWMYATAAEVFALNNLLVALQLYFAARAWSRQDTRFVYATAFAVGLGGSNHLTSLVTGVIVLAGLLWHTRDQWRTLTPVLGLLIALLAGLLPYLLLPIVSWEATPSAAQWGDQSTLAGLFDHVSRREYGTMRLGGSSFGGRMSTFEQLAYYGLDAGRQMVWVGVPLAAWGVFRGLQDRRLRGPVTLSIAGYIVFLLSFHSLSNIPLDQPLFHDIVARFWQQPNLFVCAWVSLGVAALTPRVRRFLAPAVLVLVGCQIALNARAADHHRNWTVHDYGMSVLRPLPERTLVLTRGDLIMNSARYLQSSAGVRPDVRILDQEMLTFRWMKGLVGRRMPEITIPGAYYHVRDPGTYTLRQLVDANIDRRPVVICGGVKEGDSSLDAAYDLWPLGLCSQLLPKDATADVADWLRRSEAALPTFRPGTSAETAAGSWERAAWNDYFEAQHRRGFTLLTLAIARADRGPLFAQAAAIFEDLIQRNPWPPPYYFKNAGIAYGRLAGTSPDMASKASEALRIYLKLASPGDPDIPAIGKVIAELDAVKR
jgi:hypothetical protein